MSLNDQGTFQRGAEVSSVQGCLQKKKKNYRGNKFCCKET